MITVNLYANRRLYSSTEARYITLLDIIGYVEKDIKFTVIHFDTKKDLTNQTLIKALIEIKEDLPSELLRDLIKDASSRKVKALSSKGKAAAINMLSFARVTPTEKIGNSKTNKLGRSRKIG